MNRTQFCGHVCPKKDNSWYYYEYFTNNRNYYNVNSGNKQKWSSASNENPETNPNESTFMKHISSNFEIIQYLTLEKKKKQTNTYPQKQNCYYAHG